MSFNFIVPVRHPSSVKNKEEQKAFLLDLFGSLEAQTATDFRVFIVVNREQELPELPKFVKRVDVDIPYEPLAFKSTTAAEYHSFVRLDKGRRVAAAFEQFDAEEFVMVIDDDDAVRNDLVEYILTNAELGPRWVIDKGFGWYTGARHFHVINQFHRICGTSLIVRAKEYEYAKLSSHSSREIHEGALRELGSHRILVTRGRKHSKDFLRVPFRAAIYRRGNVNGVETFNAGLRAVQLQRDPILFRLRSFKNRISIRWSDRFGANRDEILREHDVREWQRVSAKELWGDYFGSRRPVCLE